MVNSSCRRWWFLIVAQQARGIHVDDVPLVVHADPPVEHKAYVHRSGRTARAGAAGQVVTIATPDQVAEVRMLLKKAGVTATWEGIAVHPGNAAPKAAAPSRSANRGNTRPPRSLSDYPPKASKPSFNEDHLTTQ